MSWLFDRASPHIALAALQLFAPRAKHNEPPNERSFYFTALGIEAASRQGFRDQPELHEDVTRHTIWLRIKRYQGQRVSAAPL